MLKTQYCAYVCICMFMYMSKHECTCTQLCKMVAQEASVHPVTNHLCYICVIHPGVTLALRVMVNGMTNVGTIIASSLQLYITLHS